MPELNCHPQRGNGKGQKATGGGGFPNKTAAAAVREGPKSAELTRVHTEILLLSGKSIK